MSLEKRVEKEEANFIPLNGHIGTESERNRHLDFPKATEKTGYIAMESVVHLQFDQLG